MSETILKGTARRALYTMLASWGNIILFTGFAFFSDEVHTRSSWNRTRWIRWYQNTDCHRSFPFLYITCFFRLIHAEKLANHLLL